MKQDIRLYLCGKRADLQGDPKLLYNYKITDTENPGAVKNSFSKTITLEGTDNNNAIFGEIYDLSRLQQYGAGDYSGKDFNPLKRANFELYIDSEIYETGYFKLTDITKTKGNITYSITLFGGLGEFMYNLQEAPGGNKLEFKDLKLYRDTYGEEPVPDLGFTINKETVNEAWNNVQSYSSKYSTLNFVPCYNGVPQDFGADTVLINLSGHSRDINNITSISSYHDWAKGEASREMTEWETRDLRCHLQRPALRVKHLINSICVPENNGGYEVKLDQHFFNSENPYYEDTFITLNLVKDINGEGEDNVTTITGATIAGRHTWGEGYDIDTDADFSEFTNLDLTLQINMDKQSGNTASAYYFSTWKDITPEFTLRTKYVRDYEYYSAILVQLVACDETGKEVAASAAYQITNQVPGKDTPDFTRFMNEEATVTEWKTLYGYFALSGGTYTLVDMNGQPMAIKFRFPSSTSFHSLKLRFQRPYIENWKYTFIGGSISHPFRDGANRMWENTKEVFKHNYELSEVMDLRAALMYDSLSIPEFTASATRYGGFLTGKYIPQDRILTLGITPGTFLLSFTKLFGLHIWKDPVEKIIYIADRDSFYRREEIIDLQDYIDRDKAIKITPQVATAKWYDFNVEQHESEANNQYGETYGGIDFGLQRVNTSFDFDSNTVSVYDGEFKGGIQVLEKSPYYYNDYDLWPVYCYNGFTITTYRDNGSELEGTEHTVNTLGDTNYYPINASYAGFDLFDKPQFHTEDNSAAEGALTLVFFTGMVEAASTTAGFISYWLTDDLEEMVTLNDKTPCWIMTDSAEAYGGTTIAIRRNELPQFSRYKIFSSNGKITHTLDFGKTLETYVPGTELTSGSSIYERCWKDYIADMYDVNSRILNCSVLIRGQVNPDWLRRFYYFDNSYWRLNQVKEWNPGIYETTMCEFLKVNNLENYSLQRITSDGNIDFVLPELIETAHIGNIRYYTVPYYTSNIAANIIVEDGGTWSFGDGPGAEYQVEYEANGGSSGYTEYHAYSGITQNNIEGGTGTTSTIFTIGENSASARNRTFRFNIVVYGHSGDEFRWVYITQGYQGDGDIRINRFAGSGPVNANGGTVLLSVSSSHPWTAECPYNYTTLDKYSGGTENTTIEMTVAANSGSERPCTVTVRNTNMNAATFTVQQNASGNTNVLNFNVDTYTFSDPAGGTINGYIYCPSGYTDGWTVTECPAWITLNHTSGGTGRTDITLTAAANTGETRFGAVTVKADWETKTVNFGQSSAQITGIQIELGSYALPQQGGTYTAQVKSAVDGWVLEHSTWLTPSISGGNSGTTDFTFTAAINSGSYGRVGYIGARGGNYYDEASVTQDA